MTHSLTLGSLLLTDSIADDDHGYVFNVLADGVGFGVAAGVQEVVTSLLADGDLVRTTRYGNREVTFVVEITGPDLAALARGEEALRNEVGRGNTLTWSAPDVLSVPTVFDVITSSMSQQFDDLNELRRVRTFSVTLTCGPFARSVDSVTVQALTPPGTPASFVVNSADTTTGWSAVGGPLFSQGPVTVTDEGSYVQAKIPKDPRPALAITLTTAAVSLAGTRYLRVEVSGDSVVNPTFLVEVDGVWWSVGASMSIATTSGTTMHHLDVGSLGANLTGLTVSKRYASAYGTVALTINVHDVTRTNTLGHVSPRQITRVIEVGDTERTPASLHAFTASGYLGNTIIHTTPYEPGGYTPDLKRWRLSGNGTTTNASARKITGAWEALQPASVIAAVPADQLPRGDYILMGAIKSSATGERAISWAVKSLLDATVVGNTTGTAYYNFGIADQLEYVPLGVVSAPSVRSEGRLTIQIHLSNPAPGTVDLHMEEWWMFKDGPDSALSVVGTDEANLYIESPDVTSGVPRVWVGTGGTRFHPNSRLIAQGSHTFPPGSMQVTTVSDANDNLEVELSYFKRWHSNAAE